MLLITSIASGSSRITSLTKYYSLSLTPLQVMDMWSSLAARTNLPETQIISLEGAYRSLPVTYA